MFDDQRVAEILQWAQSKLRMLRIETRMQRIADVMVDFGELRCKSVRVIHKGSKISAALFGTFFQAKPIEISISGTQIGGIGGSYQM